MTMPDRLPETRTGGFQLDLGRRLVAEALGTGLLIIAVIGSGDRGLSTLTRRRRPPTTRKRRRHR